MNKLRSSVVLVVCLLSAFAVSAENNYPYPGKETPVPCTGCPGDSNGLLTWPYDDPIVDHAGRYVDSAQTGNVQNAGMRTVRARRVRVSPATGRVYLQLGETVGGYPLDQFFTTILRQPMSLVSVMLTGSPYQRYSWPLEKVARPGSFLYPEAMQSGWMTEWLDAQVTLTDFDADDRGYVYAGTVYWGWGIVRDVDVTNTKHMTFVSQVLDAGIETNSVIALKSGDQYYSVISNALTSASAARTKIYDVTTPATPVILATRSGNATSIRQWARYDAGQRLAVINGDGHLRIYDYAAFIAGGAALADLTPTVSKSFKGLAFDENGTLWYTESNTGGGAATELLRRAVPSGGGYTSSGLDVYGSAFKPTVIAAGAGYLAVMGRNAQNAPELRLLRVIGGTPQIVATDEFFTRYYHVPPAGYTTPSNFPLVYIAQSDVRIVEQADKTYLFYSVEGLGDVYELERTTVSPNRIPTSIALTSSPNPSSGQQAVTVTATLTVDTAGAAPPDGAVSFTRNGVAYGTASLVAGAGNTYSATLVRNDLNLGASDLTASFEGDDEYAPSGPAEHTHHGAVVAPVIVATATGTSSISVTWTPLSGVQYDVLRATTIGGFAFRVQVEGGSYTDGSVAAGTTYLYKVQAVQYDDSPGPISALDAATTVAFSDAGIPTGTKVKAAHMSELRTAVQAFRTAAGLAPATFTDATLSASMIIKGVHFTELRTAADQARATLGLGAIPVTPVTPGETPVRRLDVVTLRDAVN
ncbi:MAG TPA: Ig-like domain-containing protein [Thermoanaerobaculia bacterium]|nr:Ig-like domain-containing protein [Thermoanaerobaculia bacterium]